MRFAILWVVDIEKFKQKRIEGRKQLLEKIISTFKSLNPIAIHQFGSGTKQYKDEFSDIDIWITFKDNEIDQVLINLNKIFEGIAPILIRHHSKSWSPVGGSSNSIIHDTKFGLFVVDYYISKKSRTIIRKGAAILFGDDTLKRGEWILHKDVNNKIHDSHTQTKDINLLIDLIFISVKGIVRKWDDDSFINTFKTLHKAFRKKYNGIIKRRLIKLDFKTDHKILSDLYQISDRKQKLAIYKIREYIKQVEQLYEKEMTATGD